MRNRQFVFTPKIQYKLVASLRPALPVGRGQGYEYSVESSKEKPLINQRFFFAAN